ncbi:agmatine deiminase family protein [Nocardia transvalensis]|uniref:agmatine deiminase family protein n=1 Tax=Nocardia transvalensis TaxID=37333 RepID=UPI0018960D9F|nr:agmatine deiminase family protein [Nocardia transvalensis]MBF6328610.1 agmatine deiminase family protein [Nocardia transvalensis]
MTRYVMPAESAPHARTWLAWPAKESVWEELLPRVRAEVAGLARAIAEHEPVTMAARREHVEEAQRACGPAVEVVAAPLDDLWMRDTGPVFVTAPDGTLAGIDFNFNGWGQKAECHLDAKVARKVLELVGIPRVIAPIVAEAGALEVDGAGTLLATESSLINPNRNPGLGHDDIEKAMADLLGITKVVWLQGVADEDVTDCHVDAVARFAEPGVVLLDWPVDPDPADVFVRAAAQARAILMEATDAAGRRFDIVELPQPDPAAMPGTRGSEFLYSYVNFYVGNDAVYLPAYGDRRGDDRAAGILADLFPGRDVVRVEYNAVAEGGGGIHCSTQQQPLV